MIVWTFLQKVFNWLFPILCAGCGMEDTLLCAECRSGIRAPAAQTCPRCRRPTEWGLVCQFCWESALRGVAVAFLYQKEGALAKMLHFYKYGGLEDYGGKLAELLNERVRQDFRTFIEDHFDLITWTPLSRKKRRGRGFNQTELLARSLQVSLPKHELLQKLRESRAQMELRRKDRLVNLRGAFDVKIPDSALKLLGAGKSPLAGKRVLVVDDVATTLATLEEIASTLRAAGAAVVYGLVLARQME